MTAEASGTVTGQPVVFMFVPEVVALSSGEVAGPTRPPLPATVERVNIAGGLVTVRLRFPDGTPSNARITPAALAELALAPGDEAIAMVKTTQVRVVDTGHSTSMATRGSSAETDTLT